MQARQLFWIGCVIGCGAIGLVVWLANSVTFTYQHWQDPSRKFVLDGDRVVLESALSATVPNPAPGNASSPAEPTAAPVPGVARAVVEEPVHDFGRMDPLTMSSHTFLVRNEGTGPLELTAGPTTCKCTLSNVDQKQIPAGGVAEVRLEWNSGKTPVFSHTAMLFTNDPEHQELELRVQGTVRPLLGVEPASLMFAEVARDRPTQADVVLYSQVWSSLAIEKAKASLPELTWSSQPLDEATLRTHGALSGVRLTVTIPGDLETGNFQEWLHLEVSGRPGAARGDNSGDDKAGEEEIAVERKTYDLAVAGSVPGRISVLGAKLDADAGCVQLGTLDRGRGGQTRLTVRVRDANPELIVREVVAEPSFLRVTLVPASASGLYSLVVEVPPDAPLGSHLGEARGRFVLKFDHQRIPELTLGVEFAVAEPAPRR